MPDGKPVLSRFIALDQALQTFLQSVLRFKSATQRAGVDVLLQNHMLMDPIQPKLDALAARRRGDRHPFVVGTAEYQVARWSRMVRQNESGLNFGGTTIVPPDIKVAMVEAIKPWT